MRERDTPAAGSAKLKATIQQTEQVITVATRGPGDFALMKLFTLTDAATQPIYNS